MNPLAREALCAADGAPDGGSCASPRRATGFGFDVHRLAPGRRLVLLGVEMPGPVGLEGHSDADVALHAVTDAILGAIGAGDIGQHFPPSEVRWKDADSARFLHHAAALAAARGGVVEHVDVAILGAHEALGDHLEAMRASLAALLGLSPGQTSVKVSAMRRLGFAGRSEGLAAQAVVTLVFASGSGRPE